VESEAVEGVNKKWQRRFCSHSHVRRQVSECRADDFVSELVGNQKCFVVTVISEVTGWSKHLAQARETLANVCDVD